MAAVGEGGEGPQKGRGITQTRGVVAGRRAKAQSADNDSKRRACMEDRGLGQAGTAKVNNGEWGGEGHTRRGNATRGKVEMGEETQKGKVQSRGYTRTTHDRSGTETGTHDAEEHTSPLSWEREHEGGCGLTS